MCGIVSQAQHLRNSLTAPAGPAAAASQPDILWHDNNVTVYREKTNPVSSQGHIILALK
jgi:hypothetical protein